MNAFLIAIEVAIKSGFYLTSKYLIRKQGLERVLTAY